MAVRRLFVEQIIKIVGAVVAQAQKRRSADCGYSRSFRFARGSDRLEWRSTHSAKTVLRVIFVTALVAAGCHESRHHYTNLWMMIGAIPLVWQMRP